MSFNEKSTWVSLAILVFAFAGYFKTVYKLFDADQLTSASTVGLFIGVVVLIVILQVVLHIAIAVINPREASQASDERDRMITRQAGNISGYVLAAGVIAVAVFGLSQNTTTLVMSHLLLLSLVISQASEYLLMIYYYRRGI